MSFFRIDSHFLKSEPPAPISMVYTGKCVHSSVPGSAPGH
jgi:hypothetical protein